MCLGAEVPSAAACGATRRFFRRIHSGIVIELVIGYNGRVTVTQLRPPDQAAACVAQARRAVAEGSAVPAGALTTHELGELVAELAALESQVAAWRLAVAAEADVRRVAEETADTDTTAWLTRLTADPREVAAGGLWLARRLGESYPATREAFAAGRLRIEQVRVIVKAADNAPAGLTADQVAEAEAGLVARATGAVGGRPVNAKRLRVLARRMFETISREAADRHESDLLDAEADRAEAETWCTLHDNGDGTYAGRFVIPELHGLILKTALDRLTAPRHLHTGPDGRPVADPTLISTPNWSERLGMGLLELIEHHLPTGGYAANAVGVLVTLDYDKLISGIGAAGLDTGTRISARDARRLACNAGVIPAVLGGRSQPLDLGRTRRLHSGAQRKALALIHDSCAIGTCDRPFAWTEIHHLHPWSEGGRTDLANALPLCGHHHRRAHDPGYDLRRHADGNWRFHRRR